LEQSVSRRNRSASRDVRHAGRDRSGNDTLFGGGGVLLRDRAGDDRLFGGTGKDRVERRGIGTDLDDGGGGFDTVGFNFHAAAGVIADLADISRNAGMAAGLTLVGIEGLVGVDRDDDLRGSVAGDGLGGDRLADRAGKDSLCGGRGADLLIGGTGSDQCILGAESRDSADVIADFVQGTDRIAIEAEGFGLAAGSAIGLVIGTDPVRTAARPQFLFETDTGRLWFDADGSAGDAEAGLLATLEGLSMLAVSDFLLL
jgi:Ca2+-binding RTX toxin-like protein